MIRFRNLVNRFADTPTEDLMRRLIDYVESDEPTDEDLAYLTIQLVRSGTQLTQNGDNTVDIASTGGPSSLSTLLCPLYLRALGYIVPKLGIPGRPAGGIDVLAQIPEYRIIFDQIEIENILKSNGYVHFLASKEFTPLDAMLYSFRKKIDKVNIPGLAIASLLAKKKAVGVTLVGLDVRVAPHGNFGANQSIAISNAERFCRVAKLVELEAICFLSDAVKPYQPFIGRGESLLALYHILNDSADYWLSNHNDFCYAMVCRLLTEKLCKENIKRPSRQILSLVFQDNLKCQGTTYNRFEHYVKDVIDKHNLVLTAPKSGFINIDLASIRNIIVNLQNLYISETHPFPDPCGIILRANQGSYIRKGGTIATVRCIKQSAEKMLKDLAESIKISPEPVPNIYFTEVN